MLVSLSEFRDKKIRVLHTKRLESLCANYSKSHPVNFAVEDDGVKEGRFAGSNIYKGVFSTKELSAFAILVFFLVALSISFKSKFVLLCILPLLFFVNYLKNSKQKARDKVFIEEYPSVLLATASNLKAGLSVYSALERAIQLLDDGSVTKAEIKQLLEKVSRGVPKEEAVRDFATDIRLPELRLFKRAFLLVLVHGGKFSRTLERLSEVSRDRDSLIKSAQVSTASMRMTGNVLLAMAPFLMIMLSLRTKNFWTTITENQVASSMASTGAIIVFMSFYILRKLSDFKP